MILVTGASKGLGRVIADRLVRKNIEVIGVARNPVDADFKMMSLDVQAEQDVDRLAKELRASGSTLEGIVNAAGIASMNLAIMTPPGTSRRIVGTNLLGTIFMCQTLLPMLIRSGGGSIINFSTIAVALGLAGESVYSASKAGVEAYSRTLAREVSAFNVRVNCIAPGPIDTDLTRGVPEESLDEIVQRQIVRKRFEPGDVADVVELLLSPKAASLSGQVLSVGGA